MHLFKTLIISYIFQSLLIVNLFSKPIEKPLSTIHHLQQVSSIQHVTVLPIENTLAPTANALPHYLFLPTSTKHVVVESSPINFSKEAHSFKSHARHYIAFWGLFFLMRLTQ